MRLFCGTLSHIAQFLFNNVQASAHVLSLLKAKGHLSIKRLFKYILTAAYDADIRIEMVHKVT